jgi:coiled-coil and C2 domain-containing protein 2A
MLRWCLSFECSPEEEPLLDIDAEEDSWKYYQVGRALYEPFHERKKKEDEVLFSPRLRAGKLMTSIICALMRSVILLPAKIEDRLVEGSAPRYLEEEGFYVGTRPAVAPTNLHRMENRLLAEPGEVLFHKISVLIFMFPLYISVGS